MAKRRRLSAEDEALWRLVAATVKPLRGRAVAPPEREPDPAAPAPPAPKPAPLLPPNGARLRPSPPPPPAPLGDRSGDKRVRRGKLDIAASLDLHGYTQDQARAALERFLALQQAQGAQVVIVVTGRGFRRSEDGTATEGVLRRRLPDWLNAPHLKAMLSGFAPAHARHGGAGAWYVFLKRPGGGG